MNLIFLYFTVAMQIVCAISLLLIIRTVKKTNMEAVKSANDLGSILSVYKEYISAKGISLLLIIHLLSLVLIVCGVAAIFIYGKA